MAQPTTPLAFHPFQDAHQWLSKTGPVMIESRALGIKVPEDVSIIGFDNVEFAAHLEPPLSTIDVPAKELGESAADFLVRRVTGQSVVQAIHL